MQLQEQINYLKLAESYAGLGHWSIDVMNGELYWSDQVFVIHGLEPGCRKPTVDWAIEFYHPEDKQRVEAFVSSAIERGKPFQFSLRIVRADGETRHVKSKAECQFNDRGELVSVFGIFHDVTDEIRSKECHEKTEHAHQNFLETTGDGFWDWHIQDDYEYMSPRFWQIFGYSPSEKPHKPSAWQDIIFEEDLKTVLENIDKHISSKGEYPFEQEVRYHHKDGSTVTVLSRGRVIEWNEKQQPTRMIGTHTDITELKQKAQDLEKTLSFQKLLMDVNTDLIFVKDKKFRIIEANPAFFSLYPEEYHDKIIGYTTLEDYDEEQANKFLLEDKKAFSEGLSEVVETIDFPDGKRRTLLTKKLRFEDINHDVFILGIARDITDMKQVEEDLLKANAELEEFSYRTSHDLRSPLISSSKLLSIIREKMLDGDIEKSLSYIDIVQKSLMKLDNLASDILQLTKLNNSELSKESIDIEKIIGSSLQKFAYMDNFDHIEFTFDYDGPTLIFSTTEYIELIVENLLSNAIKYQDINKEISTVKVSTKIEKDRFILSVMDNGLGVPKRSQKDLFKMFKRLHSNTSFGSGLGLYMLKKNIEKIGGNISYYGTGEGSEFIVSLPI